MNNLTFWRLLDQYSWQKDKNSFHIQTDVSSLLKTAYEEKLDILAAVIQTGRDTFNQAYLGSRDERFLVCYTSKEMAVNGARKYHTDSMSFPVYEMMNNFFNKKSFMGIVLNPNDEQKILLVMRSFLETAMPGPKPKPAGYKES